MKKEAQTLARTITWHILTTWQSVMDCAISITKETINMDRIFFWFDFGDPKTFSEITTILFNYRDGPKARV